MSIQSFNQNSYATNSHFELDSMLYQLNRVHFACMYFLSHMFAVASMYSRTMHSTLVKLWTRHLRIVLLFLLHISLVSFDAGCYFCYTLKWCRSIHLFPVIWQLELDKKNILPDIVWCSMMLYSCLYGYLGQSHLVTNHFRPCAHCICLAASLPLSPAQRIGLFIVFFLNPKCRWCGGCQVLKQVGWSFD